MSKPTPLPNPQSVEEMTRMVGEELKKFSDFQLRDAFEKYLVVPYQEIREWDFADHDGQAQTMPCWILGDFESRDVGFAYSPAGFGSYGSPWDLISFSDEYFGLDCGWYQTLEQLALDCGYLDEFITR